MTAESKTQLEKKVEAMIEQHRGSIAALVEITRDPERIRRLCETAIREGERELRGSM